MEMVFRDRKESFCIPNMTHPTNCLAHRSLLRAECVLMSENNNQHSIDEPLAIPVQHTKAMFVFVL
jgi:hypothetical protein